VSISTRIGLLALLVFPTASADAHTTGGAFILLLPTHLYIAAGALVVAASFLLITLIPSGRFAKLEGIKRRLAVVNRSGAQGSLASVLPSLVAFLVVLALLAAGYWGSRDPLSNPLPPFVWSVWWIGLTYLHVAFGNLWVYINPWRGVYRVATSLGPMTRWRERPPVRYPRKSGYWPAVLFFFVFVWFELIHPAPSDPSVLAAAAASYVALNFVGIFLFGESVWLQYCEAFSVFFRVIAWLSPLGVRTAKAHCGCHTECRASRNCLNCAQCQTEAGPKEVDATLPTLNLLSVSPLSLSGVAFILLALSSVSFDGLSRTFFWLQLVGENPLEYPGRTALVARNTAGLLGLFATLSLAYMAVACVAKALSASRVDVSHVFGVFVLSIVPIAFGYHAAHYLPVFLVDIQHAVRAASDPLDLGWDLLGTRDLAVITSFLSDPSRVYKVWHTQVMIIVAAHVAAVYIAHALALRVARSAKTAIISQVPMTLLMVGYTMFGLWLLSTPSAG
jgi:hypothetical protein